MSNVAVVKALYRACLRFSSAVDGVPFELLSRDAKLLCPHSPLAAVVATQGSQQIRWLAEHEFRQCADHQARRVVQTHVHRPDGCTFDSNAPTVIANQILAAQQHSCALLQCHPQVLMRGMQGEAANEALDRGFAALQVLMSVSDNMNDCSHRPCARGSVLGPAAGCTPMAQQGRGLQQGQSA